MTNEDWWEFYAAPLHGAIDESMAMADSVSKADRLAILVERCPWLLTELPRAIPVEDSADPEPSEDWTPVQSSNLEAVRIWNPEPGELRVRFRNGAEWSYADVPGSIISGLIDAGSPGGFFAAEIKGKFPAKQVRPAK